MALPSLFDGGALRDQVAYTLKFFAFIEERARPEARGELAIGVGGEVRQHVEVDFRRALANRAQHKPLPSARFTSSTTTSGRPATISRIAASAHEAWPTTLAPGIESSMSTSRARTSEESSTMKTCMSAVCGRGAARDIGGG
jgi:hypothetical protein